MSYVERGVKVVKMPAGKDPTAANARTCPGWVVRRSAGDGVEILMDANSVYFAEHAFPMANDLAQFGFGWFKEPLRWPTAFKAG